MNAKVLRVLEYDKVIRMLEAKATSDPGRELCRSLEPMTDLSQIEKAQLEFWQQQAPRHVPALP